MSDDMRQDDVEELRARRVYSTTTAGDGTMNKAELIAAINQAKDISPCDTFDRGFNAGLCRAQTLAEQLTDPPAMAWQQPDHEGPAYVEGMGRELFLLDKDGQLGWCYTTQRGGARYLLLNHCVCYIPDPPPLPEQERAKP